MTSIWPSRSLWIGLVLVSGCSSNSLPAPHFAQSEAPAAPLSTPVRENPKAALPAAEVDVRCQVVEAIAQAFLKLFSPKPDQDSKVIASSETRVSYLDNRPFREDESDLRRQFPQSADLVEDFLHKNQAPVNLPCENMTPSVVWVSQEHMRTFWKYEEEGWTKHLNRLEPRAAGLGGFSDVAISNDGKTAIGYGFFAYGDLGAEGDYWLVKKEEAGWKVSGRVAAWMR